MAPNKKKKKPASNPARGFTTVSVPSKPKVTDSTGAPSAADSTAASDAEKPAPATVSQPSTSVQTGVQEDPALRDYTPEQLEQHLEEAELQLLVDKYASKCKNDAVRQQAKLETERRLLRSQASPLNLSDWLSSETLDSVLKLVLKEEQELEPSGRDSSATKRSVSEEELCTRLWTLKETLLKLGFPESKVEDSLKHILFYFSGNAPSGSKDVVWNLDESLDWLAMHCEPDELPSYGRNKSQLSRTSEAFPSWITGNPISTVST